MFYDPMIAKLVATAPTRLEAIDRLRLALDHYQVAGVATNRQFLSSILSDADFRKGNITTGFIAEKYGDAFIASAPDDTICENLAALAVCFYGRDQARLHYDNYGPNFVTVLNGGKHRFISAGRVAVTRIRCWSMTTGRCGSLARWTSPYAGPACYLTVLLMRFRWQSKLKLMTIILLFMPGLTAFLCGSIPLMPLPI